MTTSSVESVAAPATQPGPLPATFLQLQEHEPIRSELFGLDQRLDERMQLLDARAATHVIEGLQPGCPFVPLVVGPQQVPWVRTPQEAQREPELAVLSAMAHGNAQGGLAVASAAVEAAVRLDEERKRLYADLVFRSLSAENFKKLVNLMDMSKYEPQSEVCKTWQAEGIAKGKAEAVLAVLRTRGLAVTDEQERRISTCQDAGSLSRWLVRAVTAASAEEALRDP